MKVLPLHCKWLRPSCGSNCDHMSVLSPVGNVKYSVPNQYFHAKYIDTQKSAFLKAQISTKTGLCISDTFVLNDHISPGKLVIFFPLTCRDGKFNLMPRTPPRWKYPWRVTMTTECDRRDIFLVISGDGKVVRPKTLSHCSRTDD